MCRHFRIIPYGGEGKFLNQEMVLQRPCHRQASGQAGMGRWRGFSFFKRRWFVPIKSKGFGAF